MGDLSSGRPLGTSLVHDVTDRTARVHPDAVAVRDEAGAWTYAELAEHSRAAAARLGAMGLGRGSRVVAHLAASRAYVALLYGALSQGIAFVPLSPAMRPYQLRAVLADASPAAVVTEQRADVADAGCPVVTPEEFWGGGRGLVLPRSRPGQDPAAPTDVALLIYTSGSTSTPKGVVCRHGQVAYAASAIAERVRYRPDDVVYCRLPLSFDYGLYQVFLCAAAGAELVLNSDPVEVAALRDVQRCGATVLPVVPAFAQTMIRLAARGNAGTRLRLITNTGEALTGRTAAALRSAFPGASVVAMYGMTECKRITIGEPDGDVLRPGTVGTPLPGTVVDIIQDDGKPSAPGQIGEIVVRGPHLMDGYWNAPKATAARFRPHPQTGERSLFTGDFGTLDEDGHLTFVGRRDNLFKRRGLRTSAAEIEGAGLDVPGVLQAAVAPPDPTGRLHIWVRGTASPGDVLKGITDRLGQAKTPDRCHLVDAFPLTLNGKIDTARLMRETLDNE
ncbi:class I adenylate-forming enzyme family protein [Streptomyces chromofuscus]|uniref:class I adenylate-forming enzyme family protein n=1 Tax=Streptomyces chromofuscus TaxID=42881 RepID=UPI001678D433|nr:AMP-binding protein [Streptomyces chromofuscus]GGT43300.1 long-chain acyl-CoA synthetase [Streptomyces chromofuscus]